MFTRNRRPSGVVAGIATLAFLIFSGPVAWAQQNGGIAGVVRDTGGLAMPGVTVEAASPALIEKVRSVTTDGEGRYNIVDLRPGTYAVTFSAGRLFDGAARRHRTQRRFRRPDQRQPGCRGHLGNHHGDRCLASRGHAVDPPAGSAEHAAARGPAERQHRPADPRLRHAGLRLHAGRRRAARATPGRRRAPTRSSTARPAPAPRSTASATSTFIGAGNGVGYISDQGTIQELQLETSGMGAESGSGSASLNAIPRSGGNIFAGGIDGFFSGKGMQS